MSTCRMDHSAPPATASGAIVEGQEAPAPAHRFLTPGRGWALVFVLFLAWTAGQIDRQLMSMLVEPMKRDLHFTDEQLGVLLGFAFSVTYSISSIFVAYLGDRTGRKRVLAIGLALWSLLTMACAIATTFPAMLIARLGVGIGESVIQPSALPMVAGAFPPEKRSFPLALVVSGSIVGLVITPTLMGSILHATRDMSFGPYPIVGVLRGWSSAFLVGGVVGLCVLPLLLIVREPANETGGRNAINIKQGFAQFLRYPRLYGAVILAAPVFTICVYGIIGWMPAYMSRRFGMDPREIGLALSAAWLPAVILPPFIAGAIGNYASRQDDARAFFRAFMWLMPFAAAFIVLTPLMPTAATCIVCYAGVTVCAGTILEYSTINVQQAVSPAFRSQTTAAFTACLSLIGSGLGPIIVGSLSTRVVPDHSLGTAIIITALLALPTGMLIQYQAVKRPLGEEPWLA